MNSDEWDLTNSVNLDLNNKSIKELRETFIEIQLPHGGHSEALKIGEKGIDKLIPTMMLQFSK